MNIVSLDKNTLHSTDDIMNINETKQNTSRENLKMILSGTIALVIIFIFQKTK